MRAIRVCIRNFEYIIGGRNSSNMVLGCVGPELSRDRKGIVHRSGLQDVRAFEGFHKACDNRGSFRSCQKKKGYTHPDHAEVPCQKGYRVSRNLSNFTARLPSLPARWKCGAPRLAGKTRAAGLSARVACVTNRANQERGTQSRERCEITKQLACNDEFRGVWTVPNRSELVNVFCYSCCCPCCWCFELDAVSR